MNLDLFPVSPTPESSVPLNVLYYDILQFFVFVFWHVRFFFVHVYVLNLPMIYVLHLPYENLLFFVILWYVSIQPNLDVFSTIVFVFVIHVVIFVLHLPRVIFIALGSLG